MLEEAFERASRSVFSVCLADVKHIERQDVQLIVEPPRHLLLGRRPTLFALLYHGAMLGLDKLGARRNGPGKLMVFAGHANLGDQLVILKTDLRDFDPRHRSDDVDVTQIGRASCRERVWQYV